MKDKSHRGRGKEEGRLNRCNLTYYYYLKVSKSKGIGDVDDKLSGFVDSQIRRISPDLDSVKSLEVWIVFPKQSLDYGSLHWLDWGFVYSLFSDKT